MTLNCSLTQNQYHIGVVTLTPECTVELQQRVLPAPISNKSSVTDVIVTGPFLENLPPNSPPAPPRPPWCWWFERVHLGAWPSDSVRGSRRPHEVQRKCKYLLHVLTPSHTRKAIIRTGLPRHDFNRRKMYIQFRGLKYEVLLTQRLWRMPWRRVDGYIDPNISEEPIVILVLPKYWCPRLSKWLRGNSTRHVSCCALLQICQGRHQNKNTETALHLSDYPRRL